MTLVLHLPFVSRLPGSRNVPGPPRRFYVGVGVEMVSGEEAPVVAEVRPDPRSRLGREALPYTQSGVITWRTWASRLYVPVVSGASVLAAETFAADVARPRAQWLQALDATRPADSPSWNPDAYPLETPATPGAAAINPLLLDEPDAVQATVPRSRRKPSPDVTWSDRDRAAASRFLSYALLVVDGGVWRIHEGVEPHWQADLNAEGAAVLDIETRDRREGNAFRLDRFEEASAWAANLVEGREGLPPVGVLVQGAVELLRPQFLARNDLACLARDVLLGMDKFSAATADLTSWPDAAAASEARLLAWRALGDPDPRTAVEIMEEAFGLHALLDVLPAENVNASVLKEKLRRTTGRWLLQEREGMDADDIAALSALGDG